MGGTKDGGMSNGTRGHKKQQMPQLWTETAVSQYFWLVAIFFTLYIITATQILPQISYAMKSRKSLENQAANPSSLMEGQSAASPLRAFLSGVLVSPLSATPKGDQANFSYLFGGASTSWALKI
jgi:hypothetical protein